MAIVGGFDALRKQIRLMRSNARQGRWMVGRIESTPAVERWRGDSGTTYGIFDRFETEEGREPPRVGT